MIQTPPTACEFWSDHSTPVHRMPLRDVTNTIIRANNGTWSSRTVAVSDPLQVDVETVRDAEQQSRKRPASLTNEQQTGKLDDDSYMAETKNWKTWYKTRILDLQESIDNINSRISIAEKAVNHLKNLHHTWISTRAIFWDWFLIWQRP
jgi:hypothetical protein